MKMNAIEVSYQDGNVYLTQLDLCGNDDVAIILTPEQVPLVAKWMREAAIAAREET